MAPLRLPLRWAAVAFGLSGLAWAVATSLHPNIFVGDLAETVRHTHSWQAIHLLVMAGCILAIVGSAGIVALHDSGFGRPGRWTLAGIVVGAVVTASLMFTEAFAFPLIAEEAPHLLELDGPLLGSLPLRALLVVAGAYPIGLAVLGLLATRAGVAPSAGRGLVVAVVGYLVLAGPFLPVVGVAASWALAAAHLWWAVVLWNAGAASAVDPEPSGPAMARPEPVTLAQ
jgi:hypothetical protein